MHSLDPLLDRGAFRSHSARLPLVALAGALFAATAAPALADAIAPIRQTCTTLNCGSIALPGRINAHPTSPAIANSWVGQFAGAASSCLRVQVIAETRDLAMTVVGPNGLVFTNDSGGLAACPACPRVVIGNTLNAFYTVIVANRDALVGAESAFTLRVGLYDSGNEPNCSSPTPAE